MATFDYFNTASPEKIKAVGGGRTKIAVAPERLKQIFRDCSLDLGEQSLKI